jgi:peptidoglycan/LPS O-acetylase OafA/YrhL
MADFLTGVLLAMMIREENVLINKIRNLKRIDIMFIYLLGILVICYPKFDFIAPMGYISRAIYALFFAFVLAHQTLHQDRFLHADRISYAKEAGLISYGLYIFHPLGILLAGKIYLSMSIEFSNGFIHLLAHGITGMFLTVLLARAGESGTERLKALFYRDHK